MTTTTREQLNSYGAAYLPGHLGVEILTLRKQLRREPHGRRQARHGADGFLHAASVVALADTSCGCGCRAAIVCRAMPTHLGRTTRVWDAVVSIEGSGARIATFRCTQMVLRPK